MQQTIDNTTSNSVKVIEVSTRSIIFGAIILAASLLAFTWITERAIDNAQTEATLTAALERVYAEAQIDALEGRLKVVPAEDGSYKWIESPWDNGAAPVFNTIAEYRE